jgi:hypothetical protein
MRLPTSQQRIAIVGRTGSGKTVAGLWHLSNANYLTQPWVVVDFKTDEHINSIERAKYITVNDTAKKPGIYIVQPEPGDEALADFLTRIWERGNTGVYIDEGYMMSENKRVEKRMISLLTQGRSKHIPMIVLSQRPVWMSRFVFSEADFYQVFHLNDDRDTETIGSMLPKGAYRKLPNYHSVYYDVGIDKLEYLSPVPDTDEILASFEERLRPVRKVI